MSVTYITVNAIPGGKASSASNLFLNVVTSGWGASSSTRTGSDMTRDRGGACGRDERGSGSYRRDGGGSGSRGRDGGGSGSRGRDRGGSGSLESDGGGSGSQGRDGGGSGSQERDGGGSGSRGRDDGGSSSLEMETRKDLLYFFLSKFFRLQSRSILPISTIRIIDTVSVQ